MKSISVIIPIYNCESMLHYCIDSICEQTIDKDLIEVIMVDDCSSDGSLDKCREYAAQYDYMRVISLPNNSGPSVARNEGVRSAEGEYMFFADSDDWLGPECLERLLDYITKNQVDVVIGRVINVDRSEKAGRVGWCRGKVKEYADVDFENSWEFYASMGPWGRLVKRSILTENNIEFPTDMYMFEDVYWNMQILHYAKTAAIVNDYDYYYLRRDTGIASLTTNEIVINNSIRPECVYHSIDMLTSLAEEYNYGEDHPAWKRIFLIAVKDGINFVTFAARIDPKTYPNMGREFKDKIWDRVKDHYSSWVKDNIGTELVCRFDAMEKGYDFDYEEEPLRYFVKNKYRPTNATEILRSLKFEDSKMPQLLSKEGQELIAGEQAESYLFNSNYQLINGELSGQYYIPLKITDKFDVEMRLKSGQEESAMELTLTPDVWGEPYQEKGTWKASIASSTCDELSEDAKIEYKILFSGNVIYSGYVEPWNDELGRAIPVNRDREQLKTAKRQLSSAKGQLKETKEKLKETEEALKLSKDKISKMKESYSWKVTKPLRKVRKVRDKLFCNR